VSADAVATHWVDGLIDEGGEVLVGYEHPHFGRFPAVVTRAHGEGRITTVGTVPDPSFGADLARWLVPDTTWPGLPGSVTVSSATNRDGRRVHVVHNWSWDPVSVTLPQPLVDLLDPAGATVSALDLGSWDVRVLGE
jgi:beta-galactosidase